MNISLTVDLVFCLYNIQEPVGDVRFCSVASIYKKVGKMPHVSQFKERIILERRVLWSPNLPFVVPFSAGKNRGSSQGTVELWKSLMTFSRNLIFAAQVRFAKKSSKSSVL